MDPSGVGPGAQHRGRDDRADAELLEQVGTPAANDGQDRLLEFRASFNIACARRAKVRSATTVLAVSMSQDACTRRLAAVLSIAASF
jgi:hypothetical protein